MILTIVRLKIMILILYCKKKVAVRENKMEFLSRIKGGGAAYNSLRANSCQFVGKKKASLAASFS